MDSWSGWKQWKVEWKAGVEGGVGDEVESWRRKME